MCAQQLLLQLQFNYPLFNYYVIINFLVLINQLWIGLKSVNFILKKNPMEQRALKNVNNCLYTNIYSYLETSGDISYNPYLNVVDFFNTGVN